MRITAAIIFTMTLAGCVTGPSPQDVAYRAYVEQNKPLAEQGALKWSQYYTGLYSRASSLPASDLNRLNDLISYAQKYESGAITKDQFDYHRRAATIASKADFEVAAERDRARRQAAAAAIIASMPKYEPSTYQIVQPQQQTYTTPILVAPLQKHGVTAYWTGKQEHVQTVTYQAGWKCEYNYAGRTFTRVFISTCPSSVQVE